MTHTIRGAAALACCRGCLGVQPDARVCQQGWLPTRPPHLPFGNQEAPSTIGLAFDAAGNGRRDLGALRHADARQDPGFALLGGVQRLGSFPHDISPPTQASLAPDIAIDAQGNAIAVWLRCYDGLV